MNERQRRAWAALDIGPAWVPRDRSPVAPVPSEVSVAPASPEADRAVAPGVVAESELPPSASRPARIAAMEGVPEVAGLDLDALRQRVAECRACGLCESRSRTVFGVGDPEAHWMVIGEAPGAEEDRIAAAVPVSMVMQAAYRISSANQVATRRSNLRQKGSPELRII